MQDPAEVCFRIAGFKCCMQKLCEYLLCFFFFFLSSCFLVPWSICKKKNHEYSVLCGYYVVTLTTLVKAFGNLYSKKKRIVSQVFFVLFFGQKSVLQKKKKNRGTTFEKMKIYI
jgi:hypothetical protein